MQGWQPGRLALCLVLLVGAAAALRLPPGDAGAAGALAAAAEVAGKGKEAVLNFRPIIGVLSQVGWSRAWAGQRAYALGPGSAVPYHLPHRPRCAVPQPGDPAPEGQSYIAASYIKFLESAGARAVPILYDAPPEEVERIFRSVNGFLIPGGAQVGGAAWARAGPSAAAAACVVHLRVLRVGG